LISSHGRLIVRQEIRADFLIMVAVGQVALRFAGWESTDAASFGQLNRHSYRWADKICIIGFDACLMGMVEVYIRSILIQIIWLPQKSRSPPPLVVCAWLGQLAQNPVMSGREATQAIVSTYIVQDTYFTRASSSDVAEVEADTTLSAVESARVPEVIGAMNQFISVMASIDQTYVAQAREYTRSYYSIFGEDSPSPYIDLGNFADILANESGDPAVAQAAEQLKIAISSAVISEKHGQRMTGSNGMSFHFPISDIYTFTEFNAEFPPYYAESAAQFLEKSAWDEFLAFHYTGSNLLLRKVRPLFLREPVKLLHRAHRS
jgi:hypothetical protein